MRACHYDYVPFSQSLKSVSPLGVDPSASSYKASAGRFDSRLQH